MRRGPAQARAPPTNTWRRPCGLLATLAPAGTYGWSGYHNTHFWIDPTHDLYVVFMSRAREFHGEIPKRLRAAIYGEGVAGT